MRTRSAAGAHRNPTRLAPVLLAVTLLTLLGACGDGTAGSGSDTTTYVPPGSPGTPAPASPAAGAPPSPAAIDAAQFSGTITVSAAASLTEAFAQLGEDFTAAYPDTEVLFTFDSSATLAQQIIDGAPVDVYAAADSSTMVRLTEPGLIDGEPTVFATNELVIVTKPGPQGITGLADLVGAGVISLCGEEVPCGRFAAQALDTAGVAIAESSVTRGQNVKATLSAVSEGDAVAGIVYVTDARAAGDLVATVEIPAQQNVVAAYPVGVVATTANGLVARAFVDFVTSSDAQLTLQEYGFGPPA